MTPNILLDNRGIEWSEFVAQLSRLQRMVQSEAAFAYIVTDTRLRHETERLCRDLGLEDYAYVLQPGENPPQGMLPARIMGQPASDQSAS